MNKAKGIMVAGTLTGTIVLALLAIGAKNVLAIAEQGPSDKTQEAISAQAQQEQALGAMQSKEQDYATGLSESNQKIETLNQQLNDLQVSDQQTQDAINEAQNQIAYARNRAAQLRGLIATMQSRADQWLQAIKTAQDNIAQLQAYIAQLQNPPASGGGGGSGGGSDDGGDDDGGGDD